MGCKQTWSSNYSSSTNCIQFLDFVNRVVTNSQILIDGGDPKAMDIEGKSLPTLVYLVCEKIPQYHHNFKAGVMNALVSPILTKYFF